MDDKKYGRRLSDEDHELMVTLAADGMTLREIAETLDCSLQTVNWWFTNHGYSRQDLFKFRLNAEKELDKLRAQNSWLSDEVRRLSGGAA